MGASAYASLGLSWKFSLLWETSFLKQTFYHVFSLYHILPDIHDTVSDNLIKWLHMSITCSERKFYFWTIWMYMDSQGCCKTLVFLSHISIHTGYTPDGNKRSLLYGLPTSFCFYFDCLSPSVISSISPWGAGGTVSYFQVCTSLKISLDPSGTLQWKLYKTKKSFRYFTVNTLQDKQIFLCLICCSIASICLGHSWLPQKAK